MTDQTEIPVTENGNSAESGTGVTNVTPSTESAVVTEAKAVTNVTGGHISKTPTQTPPAKDTDYQFTVLSSLPYRTFDPMCCTQFSAEIWQTLDDEVWVTYRHASDCDVWRFV